jgi:putative chitinase
MDIKLIKSLDTKYHSVLDKYGINTPLRKAHFWGQIAHESGAKPIQENLNYSSEGLAKTFKKYFPTKELANSYARKKEAIANRVYGGRMGNGAESTGDGWKYSGKGMIQITGKDNYEAFTKDTGIDVVNNPELLLTESNALISALWFWNKRSLSKYADKDDVVTVTKLINGGTIGLEERKSNVKQLKEIFK